MYDLTSFSLSEMTACGSRLRRLGESARSLEEAAARIVRYLYDHLTDPRTGESACALVRFFKTHPYGELDAELQRFARQMAGSHPVSARTKCLVLLGTAGDRPEWNTRRASAGHQAIPLASEKLVAQFPMISQLLTQFGLEVGNVVQGEASLVLDPEQRTYNVFHVPSALDSPYMPQQAAFVKPYGIRSVVGVGSTLPPDDIFAVILFSKVAISRETAEIFRPLALSMKVAVLPLVPGRVFT